MTITIIDKHLESHIFELEGCIAPFRKEIWIGGKDDKVYNTITIEGFDTFQCSILYNAEEKTWTIQEGQTRTECPKGLLSERSRACLMCRGCCVNPNTASPRYTLRIPKTPTLVNGKTIPLKGIRLVGEETISLWGSGN